MIILSAACLFNWACDNRTPHSTALQKGLDFAGSNRNELQKVLDNYSKHPDDSLKLKAACYLIENMPSNYGYYGKEVNTYANIFSIIDTLSNTRNLSNEDKEYIGDSIVDLYGLPNEDSAQKIYDSKLLNANYLIHDIDVAFLAWKNAAWRKSVCFEDFCENILPYRIKSERVEYWRSEYFERGLKWIRESPNPQNAQSAFWHIDSAMTVTWYLGNFNKYFPFGTNLSDLEKENMSTCEESTFLTVAALRAAGLPAGYDYIMHWGDFNSSHYLPRLVGKFDSSSSLITNENTDKNTWKDLAATFEAPNGHQFISSDMPKGLYVRNIRTIPKIYRFTFARPAALKIIDENVPAQYIYPEFKELNLKDVTDEYITTASIKITVPKLLEKYRVGYLSVFDINGWQPVAIGEIKNGNLVFGKIGKEVIYLPTVYYDEEVHPAGAPFYIDSNNIIHQLNANTTKNEDITLLRKYPLHAYTAYHSEMLMGGRFEGSNDSNFTHPTLLYTIKNYAFSVTVVPSASNRKFRYFRYIIPPDASFEWANIAEIAFINRQGEQLKGHLIGISGSKGHEINKAFDGNYNSYYETTDNKSGWVGLDLGVGNSQSVDSILYCPRGDTNGILPGLEYELFYWDGQQWSSLGKQIATGYNLKYKHVPCNALLWLRCSTGQEERIFTYENCMQIWW